MEGACVQPTLDIQNTHTSPKTAARILVVDDEPAILRVLADKLKGEGMVCQTASSGREALELLESHTFDAVISDLHMPGMNGLELLGEVSLKYPHTA
jgi:two-component system response regulator AtoC